MCVLLRALPGTQIGSEHEAAPVLKRIPTVRLAVSKARQISHLASFEKGKGTRDWRKELQLQWGPS